MSNVVDIVAAESHLSTPDPEPSSLGSSFLLQPVNHAAFLADYLERNLEWDATLERMGFWLDVHERLTRIANEGF